MVAIRFDDRERLQQQVSDAFGSYGEPVQIDQAMIDQFAALTGDRQWIHVDPERAARESPLRSTIAHGYLLLSLAPRLLQGIVGEPEIGGHGRIINYGIEQLRFMDPVPAGSWVHARRRLIHVRKKGPQGTQLTFATEVAVVEAARPALRYQAVLLFLP